MVEPGGFLGGVAHGDQIHAMKRDEAAVGLRILVNADGQDDQAGHLVVQFEQRRHLNHAGLAPGGPEVEQHHAAPVAGQMNGGAAVGDGEVRSPVAGLCRVCTAIAASGEGQQRE